MPEPLGSHARELLAEESVPRKLRVCDQSPWLSPGADPGRPLTETAISRRVTVVADLLGISPHTANVLARLAGRPWADYPMLRPASSETLA